MLIKIFEITGKNCITLEQGKIVYDSIYPFLIKGDLVEMDFSKVEIFASPFFNQAIGRLLENISSDDLNKQLKIKNLSAPNLATLSKVIENSKKYYSNPKHRKAVDKTINDISQNSI
jgi:DNA primase catalytic subunit